MKKTLLLCFVHGFKGDDDTFGAFPEHLRALVSHSLPKIEVKAIVYPKFETRGNLAECVGRFRDWLQEKVIDIEVSNHTPSPTVDPSVHTILIGHSMGGIVAADTLLALASDSPVDATSSAPATAANSSISSLLFPYIQGVLAFDTPYFGISPGVVAHGAEEHYNTASSAMTQLSGLSGMIWGGAAGATEADKVKDKKKPVAATTAPETSATVPAWQRWGKIAMYAAGAGAVAAGGAAAYMKRDQITEGWSWVGSHLEFVGCLMRGEELKKRVSGMIRVNEELKVGWANLYTRLGRKALNKEGSLVGSVVGNQRTFCNLPKENSQARGFFFEAINDTAGDEASAHMMMFDPKANSGFYELLENARDNIVQWTVSTWYESSTGVMKMLEMDLD